VFVEPCEIEEPVVGCMDDDYVDYNPEATEAGECLTLHTWGCMDPEAFNYDSLATISDLNSPCNTRITIQDAAGDGWGFSHIGVKQGDLQWIFTMGPGEFSQSWDLVLDSDEKVDVYYFEIPSPQQPPQETEFQTLHNSILVTNEAGDTLLCEGDNPFFDNGNGALQPFSNPEWNVYSFMPYCGTSCVPFVYGCTDAEAQNFMEDANTEDGSCYYNAGCMQAGYLEYYTQGYEADFDDGSCLTLAVFGCTDPLALNFDPEANVDVDSCIDAVLGCMDLDAYNFNPDANVPDNDTCNYDAGCVTGPGNPYWLNDECYAWVIEVDPYCCESDWDAVCIEQYGYCNDQVSSVDIAVASLIHFYPNPTAREVRIQAPVGTIITVVDASGREIASGAVNTVELPSPGMYVVMANYKGRIKRETIVRQ
jgi:hypothetical protein